MNKSSTIAWVALMTGISVADAKAAVAEPSRGVLEIGSEMVIRGKVRKPQVFFLIPKQVADGLGAEIAPRDPVEEVMAVGAVDLSPPLEDDLDGRAEGSLFGALHRATQ